MKQADLFDLSEGKRLRDVGMQKAVDHADLVDPDWSLKAYDLFTKFIALKDKPFMTEDVRLWAHDQMNLVKPPDGRAWGGVINRACKAGLIHRVGFAPMKSKNCHANPKSVWGRV